MNPDYLRPIPHLRMRTSLHSMLLRSRSHLSMAIRDFFQNNPAREGHPVFEVHPPIITSSDCEGAGEVFTLTPKSAQAAPTNFKQTPQDEKDTGKNWLYFRDSKYLTVSSQLHLEAFSAEMGDVYTLSPTFRAEESDTPRHLAEFYMLEAEYRNIDLPTLLTEVRRLVLWLTKSLQHGQIGKELLEYYSHREERGLLKGENNVDNRWRKIADTWETLEYTDAVKLLQHAYESSSGTRFVRKPVWEDGLQLEHERWLVDGYTNGRPLFVTRYPKAIKPFYMLPSSCKEDTEGHTAPASSPRETVECFDLLLPFGYGEVAGGSLREHRLSHLISTMREKGLVKQAEVGQTKLYPYLRPDESLGALEWYADLRRFGSSSHGGFGLGFDRLLAYLTGVHSVREVVPFPRVWGRADC